MNEPGPALRYFRANEGRWRGPLQFTITDEDRLTRAPITAFARIRIRLFAGVTRALGPFTMRTTVDATSRPGEVLHTTRLVKFGVTLYTAEETFHLDDDGVRFPITRRERMWPSLRWTREAGVSRGEADADGRSARYVFRFFGVELRQTGRITDEGVEIRQDLGFAQGECLLRREARPGD